MAFNYSPKISTDGLVLCLDAANTKSYPGSGTVWSDLSRGGNNGTLTNGPTFNSGNGGSIVFDGVNDYVDCGVSNISLPINITLILWIYQSTTTGYRNIITKEGATFTDLDYGFTTSPNGNLYFWFHNGSYRIHETLTNNISLTNTWYHVSAIFNDTNNTVNIYVNGTQVYNQSETTSMLAHSNSRLFVGWRNSLVSGQLFSGRISQAQIYNRALSSTEVLQNYNATKSRFGL